MTILRKENAGGHWSTKEVFDVYRGKQYGANYFLDNGKYVQDLGFTLPREEDVFHYLAPSHYYPLVSEEDQAYEMKLYFSYPTDEEDTVIRYALAFFQEFSIERSRSFWRGQNEIGCIITRVCLGSDMHEFLVIAQLLARDYNQECVKVTKKKVEVFDANAQTIARDFGSFLPGNEG